eukprot:288538-Rhodomonas_salina.2
MGGGRRSEAIVGTTQSYVYRLRVGYPPTLRCYAKVPRCPVLTAVCENHSNTVTAVRFLPLVRVTAVPFWPCPRDRGTLLAGFA